MLIGRKCIGTVAYMGGVPAVLEEFAYAWGQLVQYTGESVVAGNEYVDFTRTKVSFHSAARNKLAAEMRGDWLLQLDTDHAPEPDLLARLLHRMTAYGYDVVTGVYPFKFPPHSPVVYLGDDGFRPIGDWSTDADLLEVSAAGAGCLLVKRSVFDRIRTELKCEPFDIDPPKGEDLSFFARLKTLGIKVACDFRIECPHLTTRPLTLADYDRSKVRLADREPVGGSVLKEVA